MKRLVELLCGAIAVATMCGCASQSFIERHYYEPTPETALKREDGTAVGAVKAEVMKSGSPDWSDEKHFSILSIGK